MPLTAGVRELKNRLTYYLRLVLRGERVIVTDRSRPVALLGPLDPTATLGAPEERLATLAKAGALRLAEPRHQLQGWRPVPARGKAASRLIGEDRDSR
jgi:prevent-host-death family protein